MFTTLYKKATKIAQSLIESIQNKFSYPEVAIPINTGEEPKFIANDMFFDHLLLVQWKGKSSTYLDYQLTLIRGKSSFIESVKKESVERRIRQFKSKKWNLLGFMFPSIKKHRSLSEECIKWAVQAESALTITKAQNPITITDVEVSDFRLLRLLRDFLYLEYNGVRFCNANEANVADFARKFKSFYVKKFKTVLKRDIKGVKNTDEGRITEGDEIRLSVIMKLIHEYLTFNDGMAKSKRPYIRHLAKV